MFSGASPILQILFLPVIVLLWLTVEGPRRLWGFLYPKLQRTGRARLIWLPWVVIVGYFIVDHYIATMAAKPDPGVFIAKLELLRRGFSTILFAALENGPGRYLKIPVWGHLVHAGYFLVAAFLLSFVLGAPLWIYLGVPRKRPADDSHGSARWGTPDDAARTEMLLPKGHVGGFALGRFAQKMRGRNKNLDPVLRTYCHVVTCAPTRSGKGVGCVVPHLLEYPGSVFCLDIKGENAAVTARRRTEMGQEVAVIDPFRLTGLPPKSVNWIDWLDTDDPDCVSEAAALADMLVVRDNDQDSHWNDSAQTLLQGLLLYVASLPHSERHPAKLREMLTLPEPELLALLEELSDDRQTGFGIVARTANAMLQKADRERSGVLSTAQRHTAFLDDPRIAKSLMESEVDFDRLKTAALTVYLVIPPDKLRSQSRYVRAIIYMALRGVLRTPGQPRMPVTILLDELAQLGRMSAVEDAVSLVAGYGAKLWLLVQDLSQLQTVYPKWQTFLANSTLQAFGTQDHQTAKYLSDTLGAETLVLETHSRSESNPTTLTLGGSTTSGTGTTFHGRPLLMPDEIRRMGNQAVLVFEQGEPPYLLERLDYRRDPRLAPLADANPMYEVVRAAAAGRRPGTA